MSYERTTKDKVEYIASKFAENPGHFAATILRMYWDMEKERDCLNDKLNQIYEDAHQMEGKWHDAVKQRNQYKAERDTLIDDIAVLKANISRLEDENKALRLQADTYFDEWQTVKNLYTTLTNHIRLKAENNPGVSRYIDLVNYIDRLEQK
ncbi:MAG: hypothetical protein ABC378_13125 [Staphylococcus pseudoxylosus]|uniref:hypothetical protein n=1 Tax=Staphylococcus pseudoxylosus TaxID=2282419 RepID=UPI0031F62BD3